MKLLLSGASGFIGQHFINKLHKKYDIVALVRQNSNIDPIKNYSKVYICDQAPLNTILKNQYFDGIIHLATLYQHDYCFNDLEKMIESNIVFGSQVLEALSYNPPFFFINALTFAQFGLLNSCEYYPINFYTATKHKNYVLLVKK